MAKKKPSRKKTTAVPTRAAQAQTALRETWASTTRALSAAEAEVQKQVKSLLKRNKLSVDDATTLLRQFQARVAKERAKRMQELEARARAVQSRVRRESRNAGRFVAEAVQSTLAALNIPSRKEVAELTRKVDALSKKIDKLRKK